MKARNIAFLSILIGFLIISCSYVSTNNTFFEDTTQKVYGGNYQGAITSVINAKEKVYQTKDRVMYYLDLGMLYHYNVDYQLSNQFLTQAEQAIEELYTKSVSKAALSLLLNDNVLDYSGEDYEDLYLNIFKALNYINLEQVDEAFVEVRRVNDKLAELEDKYSAMSKNMNTSKNAKIEVKPGQNKFYNSALAHYLSILLYRNKDRWDDVRIDTEKFSDAWKSESDVYNFSKPDISATLDQDATGRLNVFCFTGKSPEKRSRTWWIRTFKDHLFIGASKESLSGNKVTNYFDMIYWKGITDNLFFKFQIPVMQSRSSQVDRIQLLVDGKSYKTALLENIDNVATSTFEVKKNMIYLKTIIRTISKGLLSKQGKDKIDEQVGNVLVSSIFNLGADLAVSATEQADLRISHFFPQHANVVEIHLSPGDHQVVINYLNKFGNVIYSDNRGSIHIDGNQLNLVESFCLQ